jgi:hypothetical protein
MQITTSNVVIRMQIFHIFYDGVEQLVRLTGEPIELDPLA